MRPAVLAGVLLALAAVVTGCADTSGTRTPPTTKPAMAWIDVELSRASPLPAISCSGSWVARGGSGQQVGQGTGFSSEQPPEILAEGVTLAGQPLGRPPVVLHALSFASFSVGGKPYRGELVLDHDDKRGVARILNRVPVEDYLLGVVPGEMPDRFGLEALKAQAVAARSYALSESAERGFVFADTRSQVYGGRSIETPLASRAVRETGGQVLIHARRVVRAWYHSTCGGRTARAASVFPDPPAGVMDREVPCPDCRQSPHYAWQRRFDGAAVCAASDLPPGPLERVTIEPATVPGRPDSVTVSSGGHEVTLSTDSFRERLSAGRPLAEQMLSTQLTALPRLEDGVLILEGRGWGHGVGLCQYGASGFAARGAACEAILARYYPGAELAPVP